MMSSPRRSSRRQAPIKTSGPLSHWRNLNQLWRQHYIDLGHCRISRCTRRLIDASDAERNELRLMELSFVALAISAAASASGRARAEKQDDLRQYIHAAIDYDLLVNDDHNGESAVELAAYYGMTGILIQLLDAGCPLKKTTSQRNAIFGAIRNGQHDALHTILSRRRSDAFRVIEEEELVETNNGKFYSSFVETVMKGDAVSAQLLLSAGCASMSDRAAKFIFNPNNRRFKRHKKLEKLLYVLYPAIPNVMNWQGELHWSFPKTDRETMNWLWHVLRHPSNPEIIPDEMWRRVFSFFGRGWFASRIYNVIGRGSTADVMLRNIID